MALITIDALERNKQELYALPRKRGRPAKSFLEQVDFNEAAFEKPANNANTTNFLIAYPNIPRDKFGRWKTCHVSETSEIFLKWLEGCQEIVDEEFGLYVWDLKIRKYTKYIWIVMENSSKKQRPFAFVDKSTANIHCPATFDDPFDHYCGNICDPGSCYSVIGPYGVKTHWAFLPTHPENVPVK